VLGLLPFGAGGMMALANPETMSVLVNDPLGRQLSGAALGMMAFGVLAIRKIVRIRM
jgi:tight adherence protein B